MSASEGFANGFEARAWWAGAPRMSLRDAPGNDAQAEAFARATTQRDAVASDHVHDADSYLGAGAVYVMPEPAQVELRERERRMACGCVPRFTLVEACAAVAERIEHEAIGSPIAQDAARRIRAAILALREERR